ncbi:hypothetical protein FA95DRAFT_1578286, partial [Auriscalpium vulgare]
MSSTWSLSVDDLGSCTEPSCSESSCPVGYFPIDVTVVNDLSRLPTLLCAYCEHPAVWHRRAAPRTSRNAPSAWDNPSQPSGSALPPEGHKSTASSAGSASKSWTQNGGLPRKTQEKMMDSRGSTSRSSKSFKEHIRHRKDHLSSGLSPAGADAFYPAGKSQQQASEESSHRKRKRAEDLKPGSKSKIGSSSRAAPGASKPLKTTKVTVILVENTARVHRGCYVRPDINKQGILDSAKLVQTLNIPESADSGTINALVDDAFRPISQYAEARIRSIANPNSTRPWTLLRSNAHQGSSTILFPEHANNVADAINSDTFMRNICAEDTRSAGLSKLRNVPAAAGFKITVYLALVKGSENIPLPSGPRRRRQQTTESSGSGDSDSDTPSHSESDPIIISDSEVPDHPSESARAQATLYLQSENNTARDWTPSPSEHAGRYGPGSSRGAAPTRDYDDAERDEMLDDPDADDDEMADNDVSGSGVSPSGSTAQQPDSPPEVPECHLALRRALCTVHQPSGSGSGSPKSWWAASRETSTDAFNFEDRRSMGNAGVTADIVWSACAEPFLTSLDFLDELVQLIEPANSHENPETSLDCRERLSLGLRLGPFGLQAAVNGLDILYNLLPATNPGITRGTYDVRLKVLTHTSETALRLLTDFLCSFPRHMYDPPGLRAVGVLLDRNKTKSTFSDADEEDWSKLTVPNLVLKRADPSALKHALEQDYGHWSDHSAMRYNAMYCGEHGLDGLITRVVHPFLDEFPIEHPHYAEFFEIFEGFFRAVDHKLTNHKK